MAASAVDSSSRNSATAGSPLVAAGAEGGAQAIGVRRRESRSFKTMSTGSLVSNSPFTKRLGGVSSPTASPQVPSTGLYSASRIPTANTSRNSPVQRRSSGSRKVSGEEEGPVKENFIPRKLSGEFNQSQDDSKLPRSRSTSPSVPFRPVRHHHSTSISGSSAFLTSATSNSNASALGGAAGAPFKPSRPAFLSNRQSRDDLLEAEPRRSSSSFAAVRKNGLVSSSPFVTKSTSPASIPAPLPAASTSTLGCSPDLMQAPYEIAPLSHESAPFAWSYQDQDDDLSHPQQQTIRTSATALGVGARPGAAGPSSAGERRIAGSSLPPPNTPPHQRTASYSGSPSPSSALSPQRRGMKGPRAPTPVEQAARMMGQDGGEETETEDLGRTLRRQPSGKTVTWAATEEVLEFEVDDRRASGVSTASTLSEDSGRYYAGDGDESYEEEHSGFEEGGSVEVHDVDVESTDDEESVVSGASTVEDMIGEIDDFMEESFDDIDVFSPSQIDPEGFQPSPQPHSQQHFAVAEEQEEPEPTTPTDATAAGYREYQTLPGPSSAFSTSSNSQVSTGTSDDADDATSLSSYDDDEAEALKYAREQILLRSQASSSPNLASIPAMRSPLPSPPTTSTATLGAPFSLAPPVAQAVNADSSNRDSTFSLPDIPGTSPFMGFEDDGAAGSVVTLDMERQRAPPATTRPLSPRAPPSQSTPTSFRITDPRASFASTRADSPILSAFGRASPPPLHSPRAQPQQQLVTPASPQNAQLSRQGSIVNSDVSSYVPSDVGSWFGSMSSGGGAGSLLIGRDRLQRKMKEHEAILGSGVSSPALEPGRFPTEASSSTATTTGAQDHEHEAVEVLQARPAPKARSATLSSNMLPTITGQAGARELEVGAPLTSELAHGMQSPLERLHRGLEGRKEGEEWRRGDSLLGVGSKGEDVEEEEEEGQMQRSESAMALREKAILERKRSKNGGKGGRRRSSSTSDAPLAETTSAPMSTLSAMPEFGFEHRLNDALPGTSAGFGDNVQSSLDDIFNSRNRTYRVHERKAVVYAADVSTGVKNAGDVDPGRAWRKKRPSNMHEVNRSLSVMSIASTSSSKKSRALTGQLFVQLREATIEGMPFPRERTSVTFSLDNGRQRVEAGIRVLDGKVVIRNEFDLVCSEGLAFTIDLHVPPKPAAPPPMLAPAPPASPTKKTGFRSVFSSPKKKVAPPPVRAAAPQALPDPFYDYVDRDGKLASAHFVFAEEASKCKLRKHRFNVPFTNTGAKRACKGAMSIDMLYVPATPSIPRDGLPKSMDEALAGMEAAERSSKVIHEGVLTQLGGDCSIWRRRNCKLRGNRLVPYNEVTKMSHVEIDLSLVTSVEDLNAPSPASTPGSRATTYDSDADLGAMDHSFRLFFKDGSSIDFFADAAETKQQWLEALRREVAIATVNTKAPPSWALTMRKLVAAGRV